MAMEFTRVSCLTRSGSELHTVFPKFFGKYLAYGVTAAGCVPGTHDLKRSIPGETILTSVGVIQLVFVFVQLFFLRVRIRHFQVHVSAVEDACEEENLGFDLFLVEGERRGIFGSTGGRQAHVRSSEILVLDALQEIDTADVLQ